MQELKEFSESVQALVSSAVKLELHGYEDTAGEIIALIRLMVSQQVKELKGNE